MSGEPTRGPPETDRDFVLFLSDRFDNVSPDGLSKFLGCSFDDAVTICSFLIVPTVCKMLGEEYLR